MGEPTPWRSLGMLATVGMTFVAATAGATLAGYFVDRWLGSSPWFTLIGLAIGIAAGFRELFRSVKAMERRSRDEP